MIDIRQSYPTMTPFVGNRFADAVGPRILLVGESHYLPDGSTQHLDPGTWYSGSAASLNAEEVHWISTARIVREACNDRFKNRAHWIWKHAFQAINEAGPGYEDYVQVAEDLAFCNFFQRPALKGESLDPAGQDVAVANAALEDTVRALNPNAVAFVSRRAWWNFGAQTSMPVPVVATSHPTCAHWNRSCKMYAGRTGRQVLVDFVRELGWPTSPPN
jgi:hypothetical protein